MLPSPEVYESEYRFWPWGGLVHSVANWIGDHAPQGASVFDWMCGTGYLLSLAKELRPDLVLAACDERDEFVSYGAAKYSGLNMAKADARTFSPRGVADVVVCTGGLHHLPYADQEPFLDHMRAYSSDDAVFLFGEEVVAPYKNEMGRRLGALELNSHLLELGLKSSWPDDLLIAALNLLRADILLEGEYKRSHEGWLRALSKKYSVEEVKWYWQPTAAVGDLVYICRKK